MSSLFVLSAVDDAIRAGAMRILVMAAPGAEIEEVGAELMEVFSGMAAGIRMPISTDAVHELMVRRPSEGGVTRFVTITLQPWLRTPQWSTYWDFMLFVNPSKHQRAGEWMEYLKDYLSPGGTWMEVWRES